MTAATPSCYSTLTADQSAALLTAKLVNAEPFFFARFGDGAIECINGKKGMTRDQEQYSRDLGTELYGVWKMLMAGENVFVGDWLSASFDAMSEYARYSAQYAELIGDGRPTFIHFESLLLMRESRALLNFYRAVKASPLRKLYMGPREHVTAARMLQAAHMVIPMQRLFEQTERLTLELMRTKFDMLLYGAGMAGNIPAVYCWEKFPERTYINLGSALDPLCFGRKTRQQQIHPMRARQFFRELL